MDNSLACNFRSESPLGRLRCGCSGYVEAYWCSNPAIDQYVTLHRATVVRKEFRLYKKGKDGTKNATLNSLTLPTCMLCPHRQGASEELKKLVMHESQPLEAASEPRKPEHQAAFAAICAGCPRINSDGASVSCNGSESDSCPQNLWPDLDALQKAAGHSRKRGCCG